MTDEDEQLRNLYAGLAMLGYITQGKPGREAIAEEAIAMADLMLDKVKARGVSCSGNRGLAAVKPKKRKE
jgi:hypothetical protein